MSSQTATSSPNQRQTPFPLAGVRISSRISRPKTAKQAWVFISGRIYWRKVANEAQDEPQTILDFRANNSLNVARIQDKTATWDVVEEHVKPGQWNGKPSIVVCGKIRGPTRRKGLYVKRNVTVDLVADDEDQRDDWMKQVRARVAPWSLIEQQIKNLADSGEVEEIRKLKEIFTNTTTARQRNQNDQTPHLHNRNPDGNAFISIWRTETG